MRLSNVGRESPALWEAAPLLPVVLALAGGVGLAWMLGGRLPLWASGAGLLAGAAGGVAGGLLPGGLLPGGRRGGLLAACALFFFSTGCLLSGVEYRRVLVDWPDGERVWTAHVLNVNKLYGEGGQADLEIDTPPYQGFTVRAYMRTDGAKPLEAGDRVRFRAFVRMPRNAGNPGEFDYRSFLLAHGVSGTAYLPAGQWTRLDGGNAAGGLPLPLRMKKLRHRLLADYAKYFHADDWVILSALTLGERSRLTPELRDLFSDTGTSHLLALSGLHLGIIFSLLQGFARRWTRKPRALAAVSLLTVAALWLFVLLAGSPLSLQRAAWMLTLSQLCAFFSRSGHPLNHLCVAAFVLLVADPFSLFDVGFQLSFLSVFSIIVGYHAFWRQYRPPRWRRGALHWVLWMQSRDGGVRSAGKRRAKWAEWGERPYNFVRNTLFPFLTTSVSAQVGTAPLVLYYFHTCAPYALLANCVVIPLAYVLLGGALCFFLLPFLRPVAAGVMQGALSLMRGTLEALAALPGAGGRLYPGGFTIAAGTAALLFLFSYLRKRRRPQLFAAALCLLCCVAAEGYRHRPGRVRPCVIVYNVPRASAVHFVASAPVSYLCSSLPADSTALRMAYIAKSFWEERGMERPLLLPENFRDGRMFRKGELMAFGPARVALLRRTLPRRGGTGRALPLSLLVVGRGCRNSLGELLSVYRPQMVVLDSSLGYYPAARLRAECGRRRLPCHDVRADGALVFPVGGGTSGKEGAL